MPETLHIPEPGQRQPGQGRSWVAWMGAATILIALVFVMWPGSGHRSSSTREAHLPFGAPEQAYAPNLHVENLELSRAENFLNQEVTTVAGNITNSGDRPVSNVEITLEFSDELGEIVLRESRTAFPSQTSPLVPGATHDFQISLEHIPTSWNIQKPAVRVSGILFTSGKE